MNTIIKKSRRLKPYDFLQILQEEYFICLVRKSIYKQEQDKIFWNKVAEGKKDKIIALGNKHNFDTIFTRTLLYDKILNIVVPKDRMPSFINLLKDEKTAKIDKFNYFGKDIEVQVKLGDSIVQGIITATNFDEQYAEVVIDNQVKKIALTQLRRDITL